MKDFMGVSYDAERMRYKAEITLPNKTRMLIGYFGDERKAAIEYDKVAAKYGKPTNILKQTRSANI